MPRTLMPKEENDSLVNGLLAAAMTAAFATIEAAGRGKKICRLASPRPPELPARAWPPIFQQSLFSMQQRSIGTAISA